MDGGQREWEELKGQGREGGEGEEGLIGRERGRRQAWERTRGMEREEKEATRWFKRGKKKMTHFLYSHTHPPPPTHTHAETCDE